MLECMGSFNLMRYSTEHGMRYCTIYKLILGSRSNSKASNIGLYVYVGQITTKWIGA